MSSREDIRHRIIGDSAALREALTLIERAAKFPDIGVLIQGETGTGKELAAQVYHEASNRKGRSFAFLLLRVLQTLSQRYLLDVCTGFVMADAL